MNRTSVFATILATAVLTLGAAGTVGAQEPTLVADEQCGAQGDQQADNNDALLCPPDAANPSAEQGATPDGQTGTAETGETGVTGGTGAIGGSGATGGTGAAAPDQQTAQSGDQGAGQQDQQGEH